EVDREDQPQQHRAQLPPAFEQPDEGDPRVVAALAGGAYYDVVRQDGSRRRRICPAGRPRRVRYTGDSGSSRHSSGASASGTIPPTANSERHPKAGISVPAAPPAATNPSENPQ